MIAARDEDRGDTFVFALGFVPQLRAGLRVDDRKSQRGQPALAAQRWGALYPLVRFLVKYGVP